MLLLYLKNYDLIIRFDYYLRSYIIPEESTIWIYSVYAFSSGRIVMFS